MRRMTLKLSIRLIADDLIEYRGGWDLSATAGRERLAMELETTEPTIRRIENGQVSDISASLMGRICFLLGTEIYDYFVVVGGEKCQ